MIYDTVRSDVLGCYGNPDPVTPFTDTLARNGNQFFNAIAPAPWTLPSHTSMLTGVYSHKHGARFVSKGKGRELSGHSIGLPSPGVKTLPAILKKNNYFSLCIGGAPALNPSMGLTRDFDIVDCYNPLRSASEINHVTEHYLSTLDKDKPLFLLINYFDAHGPYVRHDLHGGPWLSNLPGNRFIDFYTRLEDGRMLTEHIAAGDLTVTDSEMIYAKALYQSEVAFIDRYAERLNRLLQETRGDRPLIIILASDHGELFGEHNLVDHSRTLHNELIFVPLIIQSAHWQNHLFETPVSLTDLFSTIIDLSGLSSVQTADSHSLLPLLKSTSMKHESPVSEVYRDETWIKNTSEVFNRDLRSMILNDSKKVVWSDRDEPLLYDLSKDWFENSGRLPTAEESAIIETWDKAHPTVIPHGRLMEEHVTEQLKALGYISSH
ncbi:sulfatase [bacterium]|nr:sulfatase [candidate division CSSED10-310 bacterium]